MICQNCGEKVNDGSNFCGNCGKSAESAELAAVVGQSEVAAKKSGVLKKILIPAATLVMLSVVIVVGLVLNGTFGSSLAVARSLGNFSNEVAARLETTPVRALPMLMDALNVGTTTVEFDFEQEWEDWWTGQWMRSSSRGNVTMARDFNNRNSTAIVADLNIDGRNIDFSAFLDQDRAAIGTSLVSQNYYGITFDTFRNDFRSFAELIGLSDRQMDEISELVESYAEMIRGDTDDAFSDYTAALMRILLANEQTDNRASIHVAGQEMTVSRVQYTLSHQDIAILLHEWIDIFEADENVMSLFNSSPMPINGVAGILTFDSIHRDLIHEMRNLVRDFEREARGEITAAFYIGNRNRLVRATLGGSFEGRLGDVGFGIVLDLGADVNDIWRISGRFYDHLIDEFFDIEWRIRESAGRYTHTLEIRWNDRWTGERSGLSLSSDWNTQSGHFVFDYHVQDSWVNNSGELFEGNFVVNDGGFVLRFDVQHSTSWDNTDLTIIISTSNSVNINKNIDFVNISQWDQHLLDSIEDAVLNFIFGW